MQYVCNNPEVYTIKPIAILDCSFQIKFRDKMLKKRDV